MDKDKFIVEALGHKYNSHKPFLNQNPDLTTWEGFGWLWEEMVEREDWGKIKSFCGLLDYADGYNPTRFRDAVYEYLHG